MLTINNTLDGYLKDVEIKGNTIQDASNLADIRSVGDKVEGQELYEIPVLSCGKNLLSCGLEYGDISFTTGLPTTNVDTLIRTKDYIKVEPNQNIKFSNTGLYSNAWFFAYDYNKNFICIIENVNNFITPNNCKYIKFRTRKANSTTIDLVDIPSYKIQIEEGTVATPYEPYQEDKLTILSPTPLEKVGDVADRLICKDGVWGVEKRYIKKYVNSNNATIRKTFNTTSILDVPLDNFEISIKTGDQLRLETICSLDYFSPSGTGWQSQESWNKHFFSPAKDSNMGKVSMFYDKTIDDIDAKALFDSKNVLVIYRMQTPQFIPLPHDQQVKLRTFANKTNISFLTEIEGTIKAQVPKSLGATVNTHTEQINNLNKELDRVKKLEESTVSTVTTESDFTTVEATSNGYFEDVKLEGKTLVNLLNDFTSFTNRGYIYDTSSKVLKSPVGGNDSTIWSSVLPMTSVECNKSYTLILNVLGTGSRIQVRTDDAYDDINISGLPQGLNIFAFIPKGENFKIKLFDGSTKEQKSFSHLMLLEGDHTQNPPSYFEGLKSVGDTTDEIVVSSCNNIKEFKHNKVTSSLVYDFDITDIVDNNFDLFNPFSYKLKVIINDAVTNKWKRDIINLGYGVHNIKLNDGEKVIKVRGVLTDGWHSVNSEDFFNKICFSYNFKQDKKRLLFYNNETQTWEKPILREWDSIEKHANGKYYYHQRSAEVVLDGTRPAHTYGTESDTHITFNIHIPNSNGVANGNLICDKFKCANVLANNDCVWMLTPNNFYIRLNKSLLITQDVAGFNQYLQANNVTVVYQLAEEKVYECTNIDLITYANETNYIVESGAIAPKSILKVHNNISNVVSLLQKKVSLLESNITKYMITQNRMQLASTYSADSVTFKVDYALCSEEVEYSEDLYNLILNNILVGKDNYDYDKMFTMILDYASWNQISWEQFDILVGLMDMQHNPPAEELPTEDIIEEDIIENEETPVE